VRFFPFALSSSGDFLIFGRRRSSLVGMKAVFFSLSPVAGTKNNRPSFLRRKEPVWARIDSGSLRRRTGTYRLFHGEGVADHFPPISCIVRSRDLSAFSRDGSVATPPLLPRFPDQEISPVGGIGAPRPTVGTHSLLERKRVPSPKTSPFLREECTLLSRKGRCNFSLICTFRSGGQQIL